MNPTPFKDAGAVRAAFEQYVVPTYGRFELVLDRGQGSWVWDLEGRRYLDLGGGIAVNCLGHAHPELVETLTRQAGRMMHVSNLYHFPEQAALARELAERTGPGKVFFCNSGAEANEALYKLARKQGHEQGRFEVLTARGSFHGRTLAGIAATGQDKVRRGFEPIMPGFRHAGFNQLEEFEAALSPATAAILVEGIQGEGGIHPAAPEFLLGLRRLCDDHGLLLFLDSVQCGHYRSGRFHSFQKLLEEVEAAAGFLPDGIAMAKSLGGGFPMGAVWIREPYADVLGPGTHGTTFGGTPLACAVAGKILEIIDRDNLATNVENRGRQLFEGLEGLREKFPRCIQAVRGRGLMLGVELQKDLPTLGSESAPSMALVRRLMAAGLILIPSGTHVLRFLPPLNLAAEEAATSLDLLEQELKKL